jgi:hypothetical protein
LPGIPAFFRIPMHAGIKESDIIELKNTISKVGAMIKESDVVASIEYDHALTTGGKSG